MTQTVGLAMIVRDEAANVGRCLDAVRGRIHHWTIIDTGSTDDTQKIVEDNLAGVPGKLHSSEWVNFQVNRSELMELARGTADYLLLLDADMVVRFDGPFPRLTHDVYEGRILGSLDYTLPFLVRGSLPWRYHGVAHSYLACDAPTTEHVLEGFLVEDHSHTSETKLLRDLEALSHELARRPLDARTAFYLAQTYSDLDMIPEAIAAYRYRVHLDGWDEETYVARHRLGTLLCENVSFAQGAKELLAAWEMRPSRAESLRALSNSAAAVADKIPYPSDRLFVRRGAYSEVAAPVQDAAAAFRVIASLATMPERVESLKRTVRSLLPQVSRLNVYLNGFDGETPAFLHHPKIELARSEDHGDLGDVGKLWWHGNPKLPEGFRLTCDDDLEYPADYAATMVAAVERYGRRALVSLHGRRLSPGGEIEAGYYCLDDVPEDAAVNTVGTGVLAYHTSTLPCDGPLPERNMADQWVSALAQQHGIPCVVAAHRAGWLSHTEHERSMWSESQERTGSPLDVGEAREDFARSRVWRLFDIAA